MSEDKFSFHFESRTDFYFERLVPGFLMQRQPLCCSKENPCALAGYNSSDSSPSLSPIRKRSISPEGRKGGKNSVYE